MRKWLLVVITILLTMVAVLIFANLKNPHEKISYKINHMVPVDHPHFSRVFGEFLGPAFVSGNRVRGLYNGEEIFPEMLKAIRSAQKSITFESYIYWKGDVGKDFVQALSDKARAGIPVHLLLDWVGSNRIDDDSIQSLRDAGVEVEYHKALRWYNLWRMNNRTHRKILVVDGKIGFTGGVGIADEWDGNGLVSERWRDTQFVVEGPVVAQMQSTFMDNWLKNRSEVLYSAKYFPEIPVVGKTWAQVFKSSSQEGTSSAHIMYQLAIASARKSIHMEMAYFIPDERTIDEMIKAANRGVQIEILVPGEEVDSQLTRYAARKLYGKLLKQGIKIYEFQPTLFHCKVLIIDDHFVSVGSTNFDDRSFRLNDEVNLNVIDRNFALKQKEIFYKDLEHSKEITLDEWKRRPLKEKLIEQFAILLRSQL